MEVNYSQLKNWQWLLGPQLKKQNSCTNKPTPMAMESFPFRNLSLHQQLKKHALSLVQLPLFVNLLHNQHRFSNQPHNLFNNPSNNKVGINNLFNNLSNNKAGINHSNRFKMCNQRYVQVYYAEVVELALTLIGDSVQYVECKMQFVDYSQSWNSPFEIKSVSSSQTLAFLRTPGI